MRTYSDIPIRANLQLFLRDADTGRVLDYRSGHNVLTATGKAFVLRRLFSSDLSDPNHPPVSSAVVKYIGFGCGGAMQSDNQFANTQPETYLAEHLEDPLPFSVSGGTAQYLKVLEDMADNARYFPTDVIARARCLVLASELTFASATTRASGVLVGTQAPISEAGLYLSTAAPNYTAAGPLPGEADPATPNGLAFYKTFAPFNLTPNTLIEAVWEVKA